MKVKRFKKFKNGVVYALELDDGKLIAEGGEVALGSRQRARYRFGKLPLVCLQLLLLHTDLGMVLRVLGEQRAVFQIGVRQRRIRLADFR